MAQHLEIEFKNMLTEQEFKALQTYFSLNENAFFSQKNYYFDTPAFMLRDLHSALRIREKNNRFELTLKEQKIQGQLETTQPLAKEEARQMIETGELPEGPVQNRLNELGVTDNIEYFGALETHRCEIEYRGGLLVLDRSYYLKKVDFEVEYEVDDINKGEKVFLELLNELNIPRRKSQNKIARFYQEKKRSLDQT